MELAQGTHPFHWDGASSAVEFTCAVPEASPWGSSCWAGAAAVR